MLGKNISSKKEEMIYQNQLMSYRNELTEYFHSALFFYNGYYNDYMDTYRNLFEINHNDIRLEGSNDFTYAIESISKYTDNSEGYIMKIPFSALPNDDKISLEDDVNTLYKQLLNSHVDGHFDLISKDFNEGNTKESYVDYIDTNEINQYEPSYPKSYFINLARKEVVKLYIERIDFKLVIDDLKIFSPIHVADIIFKEDTYMVNEALYNELKGILETTSAGLYLIGEETRNSLELTKYSNEYIIEGHFGKTLSMIETSVINIQKNSDIYIFWAWFTTGSFNGVVY